ncbi:MAG: hypothetical protein JJU11_05105 [Candidatus Sumerlaeia bacterium]|nr:hypothetical protein [Candidatus Sumerlaeia bacterium]
MMVKIIRTEADYEEAMGRLEELLDAPAGSPEAEELEVLSLLLADYEERAFPMDFPDPVAAIRFRMEQQGLAPRDLVPYLGSPSRVSEVLNGQRRLSLNMIRRLVDGLGIPAEVLIR